MEVKLYTSALEEVGVTVNMPPWTPGYEPDSIQWGSRMFYKRVNHRPEENHEPRLSYVEGFHYCAVDVRMCPDVRMESA